MNSERYRYRIGERENAERVSTSSHGVLQPLLSLFPHPCVFPLLRSAPRAAPCQGMLSGSLNIPTARSQQARISICSTLEGQGCLGAYSGEENVIGLELSLVWGVLEAK